DRLIISVKKAQYLFKRLNSLFYIFGYNKNRPFAAMPKIRIMTKAQNFKILDGRKLIKPGGSELVLDKDFLVLKIPVNLLGDPAFILISAKAYTGNLPFHTTGFHKVNLKKRQ
ncbi:MAG: hypothetical protein PHR73_06635, partial [Candidatus Omnitrophica bacterium]|nr:hypothetical protein [Candidatus Omnitrophota bacterium]